MAWINFDKLAHITCFISEIVLRIDATPADADHAPADPFDIEIRMLRKALGPVAVTGLRALGIKLPESRRDLDRFDTNLIDGKPLKGSKNGIAGHPLERRRCRA